MKDIVVILALTKDGITKADLVYAIEKDNWNKKTRPSKKLSRQRVPSDSVRVSYFRTFSKLVEMNLIEEFHYDYICSDYFRLTPEGKRLSQKIIDNVLEESARLNQLFLNVFKDPRWRVRKKE
jgi:hypothetical protein